RIPRPRRRTLLPYTTLFRSRGQQPTARAATRDARSEAVLRGRIERPRPAGKLTRAGSSSTDRPERRRLAASPFFVRRPARLRLFRLARSPTLRDAALRVGHGCVSRPHTLLQEHRTALPWEAVPWPFHGFRLDEHSDSSRMTSTPEDGRAEPVRSDIEERVRSSFARQRMMQ